MLAGIFDKEDIKRLLFGAVEEIEEYTFVFVTLPEKYKHLQFYAENKIAYINTNYVPC